MVLETLNMLPRKTQWADLNIDVNLLAVRHAQFSFAAWAHVDSLGGNQQWHNAFK